MADDWNLVIEGWDPADEGRREAILTLGNGRFATRGAAPESRADGVHYPGTYAAGCFNRLRDDIDGQTVESESMVNLPNWLDLRFAVGDGPWFAMDEVELLQQRLTLDMRRGLLTRRLRFVDVAGRHTTVRQRRFVHMGNPYLAGLQTVVTAEDWTGTLRVSSGIDGAISNSGVARYRDLSAHHLTVLARRETDPSSVLLVARTTQSQLRVAVAARTTAVTGEETTARRLWRERGRIGHELELRMRPGVPGDDRQGGDARDLPGRGRLRTRADRGRGAGRRARASTRCSSATSWRGGSCGAGSGST